MDVQKSIMPEVYRAGCVFKHKRSCSLIPHLDPDHVLTIWYNYVVPKLFAGRLSRQAIGHPSVEEMESIIRAIAEGRMENTFPAHDFVEWCSVHFTDFLHIFYRGLKNPCEGCTNAECPIELNPSPGMAAMEHESKLKDIKRGGGDPDLWTMALTGNEVDGGARFIHGNGRVFQRHIKVRSIDELEQPDYELIERTAFDGAPSEEEERRLREHIRDQPKMIIEQMVRSRNKNVKGIGQILLKCIEGDNPDEHKFVYEYMKGIDPLNLEILPDELSTLCEPYDDRLALPLRGGKVKMLTNRFTVRTVRGDDGEFIEEDDPDIIGGESMDDESFDEMMDRLDEERRSMAIWGMKVYYQLVQDLNTPEGRFMDEFEPEYLNVKLYRLDDQSGQTLWTTVGQEMRRMVYEMEARGTDREQISQVLDEFITPFKIIGSWNPFTFPRNKPYPVCSICGDIDIFDIEDGMITCPHCQSTIRYLTPVEAELVYMPYIVNQIHSRLPIMQALQSLPDRIINLVMGVIADDEGNPVRYLPSHVKAFLLEANNEMGGKLFSGADTKNPTIRTLFNIYSCMMSYAMKNYKILMKVAFHRDESLFQVQDQIRSLMLRVWEVYQMTDEELEEARKEARENGEKLPAVKDLLQLRSELYQAAGIEDIDPVIRTALIELWVWHEYAYYCPDHGWGHGVKTRAYSSERECFHTHYLTDIEILRKEMDTSKLSEEQLEYELDKIGYRYAPTVVEDNDGVEKTSSYGESRPLVICHNKVRRIYKDIWGFFNDQQKSLHVYSPTPDELLSRSL